ncbi:MAG TPA: SPOR domain-containing protein [Burkholderiaceae bacterium]|nr:SPOR domain-containing protein [Burkholderiaceae bacterium]
MGLFSFLQGSSASDSERAGTTDPVQAARSRARRRLIGAAVLLGVGVIGFPLLFETQPRPIPVDIPIEIPRKEGAPSLPLPPPRTASAAPAVVGRVSSGVTASEAARPAPASAPSVAAPRGDATTARAEASPAPAAKAAPPKAEPPKPEPPKAEAPKPDDGARARALLEGQGTSSSEAGKSTAVAAAAPKADTASKAEASKPDAAGGRFVVQVGAYGEASSARDMRQRVDKLGLKSYTQTAEVDGAKRIRVRVGPFNSREDAEKAAGTLKAAGLPAAVMTL